VYFEQLPPTEAAAKAVCGPKVFHQRLVDARTQLRRLLADDQTQ
jgi:DNA-directed RNA polymerase specialized sigma24 family protein